MARLKGSSKVESFFFKFFERTDGELQIFTGMAFQICGAA